MVSAHLSPSRGGETVRSLTENTSVRKAVGHCLFSQSLDETEKHYFAEWVTVRVVRQQMRASSFRER